MNKGIRIRIVFSAILVSIILICICPVGQVVCYAEDSFSVTFDTPKWTYDEFHFSKVTVSGTTSTKKVKTIVFHSENGYILADSLPSLSSSGGMWVTELPKNINDKTTYRTVVGTLGSEGYTKEQTEELIKSIRFMQESADKKVTITINMDAADTALPAGTNVTRGEGSLSDHYYMYVPQNSITWSDAYNAAKSIDFLGMEGYLATVTCKEEDVILDNITMDGAWAGGVMVKENATITDEIDSSWFPTSVPIDNVEGYAWKWASGPEKNKLIKITKSYACQKKATDPATAKDAGGEDKYKAITRGTDGKLDLNSGDYVNYSNWNRNLYSGDTPVPLDDASRPLDGDEPNDNGYPDGEYCMQVHYESFGSHNPESQSENGMVKGWNDLPNSSTLIIVSGYFIEFDGIDYSSTTTVEKKEEETYEHTWKYTPQSSAGGASNDEIRITCENPDHEKCNHKKGDDKEIITIIKIVSPDIPYDSEKYDKGALKLYENNVEKSLLAYGISNTDITVSYTGRDGTTYSSDNPPVNVGKYTIKYTVKITESNSITISKDFEIKKVDLTITLNDQSVLINQDIDKGEGLIKEITGLKGSGDDADKLDSIKSGAILYDTSVTGTSDININKPYSGADSTITIKNKSGDVVTDNYNITVVHGVLTVSIREPKESIKATASPITYGEKLSDSKITGKYVDPISRDEIKGEFVWVDENKTPPVMPEVSDSETTEYDAKFIPENIDLYSPVDLKLKIKVNPKNLPESIRNGGDKGIDADISIDLSNKPIVKLKDKQTNKTLILESDKDYTIETKEESGKIKVIIKGHNNYTEDYETEFDAYLGHGQIFTRSICDSSVDELAPRLPKVPVTNGKIIFLSDIGKLNQEIADYKKAADIVKEIDDSPEHSSTKGDYRAQISVYMSKADLPTGSVEKSNIEEYVTDKISKKAEIGVYFDISMDFSYYVEELGDPGRKLKEAEFDIHDTSKASYSPGFSENVTITIPSRLRPQKGYTRKYYIIRTHRENPGSYTTTSLPFKQNGNDLTFSTDKFSTYALAYTDTKNGGGKVDPGPEDKPSEGPSGNTPEAVTAPVNNAAPIMPTTVSVVSPKTGDTADVDFALIMIMFGMILLATALKTKVRRK